MLIDQNILLFLWRWKLVSGTAIAAKFFPKLSNHAANWHLSQLKKYNLIYPYNLNTKEAKVLWGLTSHGFKVAKESLSSLSEDGFRSEHQIHDYYVTAFHLGDWLGQCPPECDIFSEQELRRYNIENYPDWVPKTSIHRPDGYWNVSLPEGMATIAVEVELKLKTSQAYQVVAKFYRDQPDVFRVVWLVPSKSHATAIRDRLSAGAPQNIGIHSFVLKEEFLNLGWQAPIHFGNEAGKPLAHLLGQRDSKTVQKFWTFSMLDTRKFPHLSQLYARFSDSPFSALGRHRLSYDPSPSETDFRTRSLPPTNTTVPKTVIPGGTNNEN